MPMQKSLVATIRAARSLGGVGKVLERASKLTLPKRVARRLARVADARVATLK